MRLCAGSEARLLAVLLSVAFAGPAQAQMGDLQAGEMKVFRDWIAGCDNTRSCTALSLPRETDDDVAFLRLDRPAGPEGNPKLTLKLRSQKLEPRFEIELSLDGAAFPKPGRSVPATSRDAELAEIVLAPTEAEALIAAARKASTLTIRTASRRFTVSLGGSVAAMLWIDERQGRLNTPSALIRKGSSGMAPPAPSVPVIGTRPASGKALPKAEAAALVKAMRAEINRREPDSCEDVPAGFTDADGAWPLDDRLRLVALACSRGAYNVSSQFWLVTGRDVASARPAAFEDSGNSPANELVNADYDPKTGQVAFFAKARGLGDCGASGSYGWNGARFVALQLSAMAECRMISGDDWITLFRSEAKLGG